MVFLSVGKKQLFYFFKRWLFAVGKNKCAVCAVAFLVQMFNFSTIFALCTTCYMENKRPFYRGISPDNRNFCSRLSFLFKCNKIVSSGLCIPRSASILLVLLNKLMLEFSFIYQFLKLFGLLDNFSHYYTSSLLDR